ITVETWIKVNNASSSFDVIFNSQGAGTARLRAVLNDGKPRFTIRDASDTPFGIQANTAINDDQWHHLAFVYDGSESTSGMTIFIDGINTATTITATNAITTATFSDSCYIGARNNANPFIGSIDEMRIWNAALSETQIRSFLAQKTVLNHPSLDRLINYYRFDENTGTTLYDLASGGTGTLFNSPTWTLSGAALGDESSYTYGGSSLSIQEENGDSILINNFVGQLDGMHLYAVNEVPNSTTIYGAENADTNYYFGVFKVGNDTTTYDLTYNYINSALINGNTNEYRAAVASRADNAYASWKSLRAEGTTDQSANTFVLPEQTGTEYIGVIGSNNALAFDGIDDQVTISGFTSPTDFTLEAWINANSYTASYHTILEFGNDDPYFGLINGQPTLYQSAVAPTAITTNQWYHVAASYDSSTQEGKVYVDGALVATSYNTITLSGVGLGIGYNSGDNRFNGMIDEVRIWSRVLCENEIQSHISCQFDAIVQTNLEAYYSFNQGISGGNNTVLDSLFDRSGNGRNGILVGFDKTGTSSNWVDGAPAINGSCSAYFPAQIAVRGNGVIITDGDITPSTSDSTDFGSLTITDSLTINYWVKNTGVDTLKIDSAYVSGADSADFTLSIASNNIASGDSSLLQLKVLPSNGDSIFASINLLTNICQNPIYNFDVRGEVYAFAGALSFDGTNDFVLISDTLGTVGLSEFTAEAWVKVSGSTGEIQAVLSSTGTEAFHFQLSDSASIHNNAVYTNNGVLFLPVFPRTPHNVWRHIALVAKSGDTRVYVNGAQIGTTNTATFDNILVTNNMRIGSGFSSGRFFNGDIDEVRLWDRALSAAEIQANASCELTGNECGLIAYYNFNNQNAFNSGNNTGLIVLGDSSGNGNDGALNNFALSGNSSNWVAQADSVNNSCSVNLDALAPNVIPVQTINVWVNNSGYFVLNATAADSASCDIGSGIETLALSQDTVFCSDNGAQVYLIVTDSAGNSDSAAFSVAVFDTIAPNVAVQNISVYLNSSAVSITTADINNGTTDNCGIASTSISSSSFTCSELGANSVTFYATDLSGNVDSAVATVTVIDSISPTALAIDTTIYLNGAGTVSITSAQIGYGSTDNCSSYTSALDQSSFNCLDTGENVIVLTITDASGNTDTAHATITVLDTLVPTVSAQNLTVYLDGSGNASISPADVDAGSTDNCGIDYLALSDSSFTCVDA
ncbi:MAG: choice-of-anchor D domain-containing protein, partial [Salibacteraceae bacterium]|nr:choice-of-anchor D domain-containing protein [Salibacteraceae bacterium]